MMDEVPPPPTDTGSAGTQEQATGSAVVRAEGALDSLPIVQSYSGLTSSHAGGLGGPVVATLVAGGLNHLEQELRAARAELSEVRSENRTLHAKVSDLREQNATLTERVRSIGRFRHLQNFAIAAGGVAFSLAFNFWRGEMYAGAVVAAAIGAALIGLSWHQRADR